MEGLLPELEIDSKALEYAPRPQVVFLKPQHLSCRFYPRLKDPLVITRETRCMNTRATPPKVFAGIALVACSFELPALEGDALPEWQLTPAGHFLPSDGREMTVPSWFIDAAVASKVIARRQSKQNDPVVDYEHQTLYKEQNGQPAPAAAWIKDLVWHEGRGLFARVELTADARDQITQKKYRYLSPVFTYHPKTGEVLDIQMAALTNFAAIDGMEPLVARAAATFGIHLENPDMKLLAAVLAALGLPPTTTEDQAIAACSAHGEALKKIRGDLGVDESTPVAGVLAACSALKANGTVINQLRTELGLQAGAGGAELLAACTSLKAQAKATEPDPAKFVPVAALTQVTTELQQLREKVDGSQLEALIADGLKTGKIIKGDHEAWARKQSVAALSAYLNATSGIAALSASQTQGKPPVVDQEHGLTEEEVAVCTATGVAPKDFAAAKAKTA